MNILAAHLNTSRAKEMLFTKMELADIGLQIVVYNKYRAPNCSIPNNFILLGIAAIEQNVFL